MQPTQTIRSWIVLLSLAIACLAFYPGLQGPFLLDDTMNLMRARAPTGNVVDVIDALVRNSSGMFRRPISNATFLLNYHVIGSSPLAYKAVNLVIHLMIALVLWRLGSALVRWIHPGRAAEAEFAGLFAALAWAAHPIQVSTVLYVVQRMTQLSALFCALAVLYFVRQAERFFNTPHSARHGYAAAAGVLAITLLALLSKENGAIIPLLLVAVTLCSTENRLRQLWQMPSGNALIKSSILAPLALGLLGLAIIFEGILSTYTIRDFTMIERVLTQPYIVSRYIWSFLAADTRAMGLFLDDIPIRGAGDLAAWGLLSAFVALALGALALRRRMPLAAFAVLWFMACHAIESTFIPLELAFEHRNYLAVFGPALAIAATAWHYVSRLGKARAIGLMLIPVLMLGGTTLRRSHQWSVPNLFAENELANHPNSPRAVIMAAELEANRGNAEGSMALLRRAQALRPNNFWMLAYDIHIACVDASVVPAWEKLLTLSDSPRNWFGLEEAIRSPATLIAQARCKGVTAQQFDGFVAALIERLIDTKIERVKLERLFVLRQQMADVMGNREVGDAMLRQAIRVNDVGTDALVLLAYRLLNRGNHDEAATIAQEWRERIRKHHRATMAFEVDEFEGYLAEARREAAAKAGHGTPAEKADTKADGE